jgi:hypothetical protein
MRIAALALTLLLAGCGGREPLRAVQGQRAPIAPATAAKVPTTAQLLEPTPIARPQRVTELLTRSEERQEDRYDLPPS